MSVETITTISPTTGEPVLSRTGISASDLDVLAQKSTEAFQSWRQTSLAERQDIIRKALVHLQKRTEELATGLTEQMGRPIQYTPNEITTAIKRAEYLVNISDDALADTPGLEESGFKRFIRKVPVGPVLIIFAWNVSSCKNRDSDLITVDAN